MRIIDQLTIRMEPVRYLNYPTIFLKLQVRYNGKEYSWQHCLDEDHFDDLFHRMLVEGEELIKDLIKKEEEDAKSKQSNIDRAPGERSRGEVSPERDDSSNGQPRNE